MHEIVKDGSGSDSNNADGNARDDKYTHHVPPVSRGRPTLFPNSKFGEADNEPPEIGYSRREGKCLRFDIDESSPQRTDASVKISQSGVFQIDKKAPDPGS